MRNNNLKEQENIMENSLRLGIIGNGFVGSSVSHGFDNDTVKQLIIDPRFGKANFKDLVNFKPQMVFVCVPTPPDAKGFQDNKIVQSVLSQLNELEYKGIIVVKSTVAPDNIKWMCEVYNDLNIVYNPEFLTEASAKDDFINPPFQILGGDWEITTSVERFYNNYSNVNLVPTYKVDVVTASMIKYTINSFLAMKVTFFNEIYQLFQHSGTKDSWNLFTDILSKETRMGHSHMKVPGPDGSRGFGGNCFPKDTQAFVNFSKTVQEKYYADVTLDLLESAIKLNKEMRS